MTMRKTIAIAVAIASLACDSFAGEIKISEFSQGLDGWTFYNGKEFPGAQGNLYQDQKTGCAILEGYFAEGGRYVSMEKRFEQPLDLKSLSLELEAENISSIMLRTIDSSGQTFQQKLELRKAKDGVLKVSCMRGDGASFWGGAKDGKWHGPAKGISILIDRAGLASLEGVKGRIKVKSVDGSCE